MFSVLDKEEEDYQKELTIPLKVIEPKVSSILSPIETPIKGLSYAQIAEKLLIQNTRIKNL